MIKSKIIFLAFSFTFCSSPHAQLTNSFGIGMSTDAKQRLFLNYNKSLNQNQSLNFRVSHGWISTKYFSDSRFFEDIATGNTKYESFVQNNSTQQTKLIFGPEIRIKESNFSWGVEGLIGYRQQNCKQTREQYAVVESSETPNGLIIQYPIERSQTWYSWKQQYISFGVQSRFSIKAMATDKIGLNLFGEIGLEYHAPISSYFFATAESIHGYWDSSPAPGSGYGFFEPQLRLGASLFIGK